MPSLSPDAVPIQQMLQSAGVTSLWHWTDIENIGGMFQQDGICSKQRLESAGILAATITGGDSLSHDLDKSVGNWDLISLTYTPHTPMVYWKKRAAPIAFLEIDTSVAGWLEVEFTDANSVRMRDACSRGKGVGALGAVNFAIVQGPIEPWNQAWVKYVQAEILVPEFIHLGFVKNIYLVSPAVEKYAINAFGAHALYKVSKLPFTDHRGMKARLEFPFVYDSYYVNQPVDGTVAKQVQGSSGPVVEGTPVSFLTKFRALTGDQVQLRIDEVQVQKAHTVSSSGGWSFWHNFTVPSQVSQINASVVLNDREWCRERIGVVL